MSDGWDDPFDDWDSREADRYARNKTGPVGWAIAAGIVIVLIAAWNGIPFPGSEEIREFMRSAPSHAGPDEATRRGPWNATLIEIDVETSATWEVWLPFDHYEPSLYEKNAGERLLSIDSDAIGGYGLDGDTPFEVAGQGIYMQGVFGLNFVFTGETASNNLSVAGSEDALTVEVREQGCKPELVSGNATSSAGEIEIPPNQTARVRLSTTEGCAVDAELTVTHAGQWTLARTRARPS